MKPKKLKVWGGRYYGNSVPFPHVGRMIVAAYTKKQISELTGISKYEINKYWCLTANDWELSIATEVGAWIIDGNFKQIVYSKLEQSEDL